MKLDWRTHCFDHLGGIADETGANGYRPIRLSNPVTDAAPIPPVEPLKIVFAAGDKPGIKLTYTSAGQTTPPGYWVKPTPDMTFTPRKGAFKPTGTAGEWTAEIELTPDVTTAEVKVFAAENLTRVKGAKPLETAKIWFAAADSPYDPPVVMTTPQPELSADLGEPYLSGPKFDALSEKRKKVIRDFLPQVTPSSVDTPPFDKLQTKAGVEQSILDMAPHRYTTCGTLTSFLSKQFKEAVRPKRMTIGGLIGCFWAAHDDGSHDPDAPAWVVAEDGVEPKPGDIFLITGLGTTPDFIRSRVPIQDSGHEEHDPNKQTYPTESFECLHVGVIVDTATGVVTAGGQPIWVVANAGQGGDQHAQQCLYTTLVLSTDASGYPLVSGRRIAGWVDIDNYTPWT